MPSHLDAILRGGHVVITYQCPCCGITSVVHPEHPMYEELRAKQLLERQQEASPEVESCEPLKPRDGDK